MDKGDEAATTQLLRATMLALEGIFPGKAVVLMVAPIGVEAAQVSYVANVRREDMIATMKEVAGRLEGCAHDAPAMRQ